MTSERIGIYGGTFDPIHNGHLSLAIEMLEKHHLDKIWFCPAAINPFKQTAYPVATCEHRSAMVGLALEGIPNCQVLNIETMENGPSYTVETLRWVTNEASRLQVTREFFLILGEDVACEFPIWHQADEIIRLATLLIGRRSHELFPSAHKETTPAITQAILEGMTQTRIMEVSSTEIRQRLAQGLCCRPWLPSKVIDYISNYRLYSASL